jgi:2'-5' RNA ligase
LKLRLIATWRRSNNNDGATLDQIASLTVNKAPRKRLFIGIAYQPSAQVSTVLKALREIAREPATGLRPVNADNLHVTVKFLGMVPESKFDPICSVMDQVLAGRAPFELEIAGFGCFRQALWLGVEPNVELDKLVTSLDLALTELEIPRDGKPYRPHLTIARLRADARLRLSELQVRYGNRQWGRLLVDSVHLFESRTLPEGVQYLRLYSRKL